ncbi:MAG: hypothetical protein ACXIT9_12175 [Nitritalea sp.]
MEENCAQKILAESYCYTITQCQVCGNIQIHDGIYVFGFTPQALRAWVKEILTLDFDRRCRYDGDIPYLQLYAPLHQYEYLFFRDQFEEYQDLLGQTLAILDAYAIVSPQV